MKFRMPSPYSWLGFFALVLLFAQAHFASAQEKKGAISGNVSDQTGAVLKGAEVSIAAKDINVKTDVRLATTFGPVRHFILAHP